MELDKRKNFIEGKEHFLNALREKLKEESGGLEKVNITGAKEHEDYEAIFNDHVLVSFVFSTTTLRRGIFKVNYYDIEGIIEAEYKKDKLEITTTLVNQAISEIKKVIANEPSRG